MRDIITMPRPEPTAVKGEPQSVDDVLDELRQCLRNAHPTELLLMITRVTFEGWVGALEGERPVPVDSRDLGNGVWAE